MAVDKAQINAEFLKYAQDKTAEKIQEDMGKAQNGATIIESMTAEQFLQHGLSWAIVENNDEIIINFGKNKRLITEEHAKLAAAQNKIKENFWMEKIVNAYEESVQEKAAADQAKRAADESKVRVENAQAQMRADRDAHRQVQKQEPPQAVEPPTPFPGYKAVGGIGGKQAKEEGSGQYTFTEVDNEVDAKGNKEHSEFLKSSATNKADDRAEVGTSMLLRSFIQDDPSDQNDTYKDTAVEYSFIWNQNLKTPFVRSRVHPGFVQELRESVMDYDVIVTPNAPSDDDLPPTKKNALVLVENYDDEKEKKSYDVYMVKDGRWVKNNLNQFKILEKQSLSLPSLNVTSKEDLATTLTNRKAEKAARLPPQDLTMALAEHKDTVTGRVPFYFLKEPPKGDPRGPEYNKYSLHIVDKLPSNPPQGNNGIVLVEKRVGGNLRYDAFEFNNGKWRKTQDTAPYSPIPQSENIKLPELPPTKLEITLENKGQVKSIIKDLTTKMGFPRLTTLKARGANLLGSNLITDTNKKIIDAEFGDPKDPNNQQRKDVARILAGNLLLANYDCQPSNLFKYRDSKGQDRIGCFDFGWGMAEIFKEKHQNIKLFSKKSPLKAQRASHVGGMQKVPTNHFNDYPEIVNSQFFVDSLRDVAKNSDRERESKVKQFFTAIEDSFKNVENLDEKKQLLLKAYHEQAMHFVGDLKVAAESEHLKIFMEEISRAEKEEDPEKMRELLEEQLDATLAERTGSLLITASLLEMRLIKENLQTTINKPLGPGEPFPKDNKDKIEQSLRGLLTTIKERKLNPPSSRNVNSFMPVKDEDAIQTKYLSDLLTFAKDNHIPIDKNLREVCDKLASATTSFFGRNTKITSEEISKVLEQGQEIEMAPLGDNKSLDDNRYRDNKHINENERLSSVVDSRNERSRSSSHSSRSSIEDDRNQRSRLSTIDKSADEPGEESVEESIEKSVDEPGEKPVEPDTPNHLRDFQRRMSKVSSESSALSNNQSQPMLPQRDRAAGVFTNNPLPPNAASILTAHALQRSASHPLGLVANTDPSKSLKTIADECCKAIISNLKFSNANVKAKVEASNQAVTIEVNNQSRIHINTNATAAQPESPQNNKNLIINEVKPTQSHAKTEADKKELLDQNVDLIAHSLMQMGDHNPKIYQGTALRAIQLIERTLQLSTEAGHVIKPEISNDTLMTRIKADPNLLGRFNKAQDDFAKLEQRPPEPEENQRPNNAGKPGRS